MSTEPVYTFPEALRRSPYPIREFLSGEDFPNTLETLNKKYALGVDVTGKVSTVLMHMLVGLVSPTQCVVKLREAKVTEVTANAILQDLNTTVLKPLHEKIKEEEQKLAESEAPVETTPPVKPATSTTPKPTQSPIPIKSSAALPLVRDPETLLPKPSVAPASSSSVKIPTTLPKPIAVVPTIPQKPVSASPIRTMMHDVEEMNGTKPLVPFFSIAVPKPPAPPPLINHPAPPTPPRSVLPPVPPSPKSQTTTPTHEEVSSSLKQYGVDPYREPVE